MSQENVEVVRDLYEAVNRWLESYWADPARSLGETPGVDDVFDRTEPGPEWDWLFSPDIFRGRDELLHAAADWIETVSDWRIEVEELIDLPVVAKNTLSPIARMSDTERLNSSMSPRISAQYRSSPPRPQ